MQLDKKALKARLLEGYAVQVDEMLDQLDGQESLHLTEIEELALKVRQEVGQHITAELAVSEGQRQAMAVACPECHAPMRYKGRKSKWVKTRTGDVQIERPYYYCEPCRCGHFPPR